ncbi:hypothetical protein HII36_35585 [Nonomuraea sp. NN258]|uniref:DUF5919 domain-containing protein n=1 Tax=Nonomuraea antri TaxID=2730852 RepID=UPI001568FE87|nr:DUF5919 domain-containing protein [Nonomuraea antri]NRQ37119.1 hypothetical protein [Nonomuraea antri]
MTRNGLMRLLFALLLIPTGMVLLLLAGDAQQGPMALLGALGGAFIVAGIVAAFREIALVRSESADTAKDIATQLHAQLQQPIGIRLQSPVRRGYDGYYQWAISTDPGKLFFAGRSVLHRIDADFTRRRLPDVEEVLVRKLEEGSEIRILFLDPRSDLVPRLAKEEGQQDRQMLSDIGVSLDVCERLYRLLQTKPVPPRAQLHIRVYDEVPHFAYHRDNDQVIVGFYFATALGSASAAFEVIDTQSQGFFEGHFTSIFERASQGRILEVSPHGPNPHFNTALVNDLRKAIGNP